MVTRFRFALLLCLYAFVNSSRAQDNWQTLLNIGDPAPPLQAGAWIKGSPIQRFEKGRTYVVEFWATWCQPCIESMRHLTSLAAKYKKRVTILAIDIYENKNKTVNQVKEFVDSMGRRMGFKVAVGDTNTVKIWYEASQEEGIPKSFVINDEGNLAWIGHPNDLALSLSQIVHKTWDINGELLRRNLNRRLAKMDDSIREVLDPYVGNLNKGDYFGEPDSAIVMIDKIVSKEQNLKYAPNMAFYTFDALLKTDPHKAFQYGKAMLATTTYEEPACYDIIDDIKSYRDRGQITPEIYELGAEAYEVRIHQIFHLTLGDAFKIYHTMADWYWHANNKRKALYAERKATKALKKLCRN